MAVRGGKMRIIISPAKKMNVDTDSLPCQGTPAFIEDTKILLEKLKSMSYPQLKNLWKCNDAIAQLNFERINTADLSRSLTPAVLSYEGIQYQYMAPSVFSSDELAYITENLRILSGFYGVLRPFDGVIPYRLEMQAKLETDRGADLYSFWKDKIAQQLADETDCIINLASKEYSRAVSKYLTEKTRFITCTFAQEKDGKLIEKGTACKMARGEMVRFMAENSITDLEQIKNFDRQNYRYSRVHSTADNFVFIR